MNNQQPKNNNKSNNKVKNSNNTEKQKTLSGLILNLHEYIKYLSNYKYHILVSIILIIASVFIYNYFKNNMLYYGYSYYNKDVLNHEPLFKSSENNLDSCKLLCKQYNDCEGVTYNNITLECLGSGEGSILRNEKDDSIISWLKGKKYSNYLLGHNNISILKNATSEPVKIDNKSIPKPYIENQFMYTFFLYIDDYNTDKWTHLMHKGTKMNMNYNFNKWTDIDSLINNQSIGLWLTPYNSVLRLAFSLVGIKNLYYVDIKLELQKLYFIVVNSYDEYIEIYINNRLLKLIQLNSIIEHNSGHMYVNYNDSTNIKLGFINYKTINISHQSIVDYYNKNIKKVKDSFF